MKKHLLPVIAITALCAPFAHSSEWFKENDALTQVHKHLLNDDLTSMFDSLVEVWQSNNSKAKQQHLDKLFAQALDRDCGKTLTKNTLPSWITSVVVKRHTIQSPGRDTFRLVIDVETPNEVKDIKLTRWVEKNVSSDTELTKTHGSNTDSETTLYRKRYNLTSALPSGLYRLNIEASDAVTWSAWVILGELPVKQEVRWASKDSWRVDKKELLNPYCPLPKVEIGLYDYINEKYERVWGRSYESDYPTTLKDATISNDRYVLAVSMIHSRWQGDITIEQSQTISKTYDISSDEELK